LFIKFSCSGKNSALNRATFVTTQIIYRFVVKHISRLLHKCINKEFTFRSYCKLITHTCTWSVSVLAKAQALSILCENSSLYIAKPTNSNHVKPNFIPQKLGMHIRQQMKWSRYVWQCSCAILKSAKNAI